MNAGDRAFILGCSGLIIQNCGHGDASNWIGFAMAVVGFAGSMIIPPLKASPPLASDQRGAE